MRNAFPSPHFHCLHCRGFVSGGFPLAGIRNRNHCPYCLWSRHLDWQSPGDRLSSCKGAMRPIGLTLKKVRKKYGGTQSGELMVIHQCVDCRAFSINRIAADDGTDILADVFLASQEAGNRIRADLEAWGIRILDHADWNAVSCQLFGRHPLAGFGSEAAGDEPAR